MSFTAKKKEEKPDIFLEESFANSLIIPLIKKEKTLFVSKIIRQI